MSMSTSRLDACGWSSFDVELFLNETGRKTRDVAEWYVRLLKDFSPGDRVLELCCGAGALGAAIARAGYRVTGVDLDERMLAVFEANLAREDPEVRRRVSLIQADACTFDVGEAFDFVILEDDSFQYLATHEDQLACLARVHEHLAEGGRFFLMFETPQRELAMHQEYDYDPIRQVKTVKADWQVEDETGRRRTVREGFEARRLTWPCELELLLKVARFEVEHRWGHLGTRVPFVDPSTQQYAFLMRKAPE